MFTIKIINIGKEDVLYVKELNNYIFLRKQIQLDVNDGRISKSKLLDIALKQSNEEYKRINNIITSWEKIENSHTTNKQSLYTLYMHPVRRCNYECEYCFAKKSNYLPSGEISLETAKKAIDFMINDWGKEAKRYVVDLAGSGEPLLRFEFIKEIEKYCEVKRKETSKDIKIMFPSNGSLISEENVEYFEKNNNILIGISIDGDETHNTNRKYKNSKKAFESTVNGIDLLKNRKVGLAATITHNNENVDEVYEYLYKRFDNADAISLNVVRDFDKESKTSFYNIDISNLLKHYKILVDNIYKNVSEGNYEYIRKLLIGTDTLGIYLCRVLCKGVLYRKRCGVGSCLLAVDEKGDLYMCSVSNGDEHFKVGDIYNGIDYSKFDYFKNANVETNKYCRKCWAAYICSGECMVSAYLTHRRMDKPNEDMCKFRRDLIYLVIQFIAKIQLQQPERYKEILKIIKNKIFFESVIDSGIWALEEYLKYNKIETGYSEILKQMKNTDLGTEPKEIIAVLSKYVEDVGAYKISDITKLEDMIYPAIAFINKAKATYYEYVLICGIEKENLIIRKQFSQKKDLVSKQYFINEISDIVIC